MRAASRLADGPNVIDFWPTMPPPNGPRPGPGPGDDALGLLHPSLTGRLRCVGVAHAASSAVSWDCDDLLVGRAGLEQLVVRAAADDHAVLEHEDLVGVEDRGDPLRDDHDRRVAW